MSVENSASMQQATWRIPQQAPSELAPQPTAKQEARQARLRRFNRLVIYLPLGVTVLAWITLLLAIFWLTIAGQWFAMDTNQAAYRALVSGIADALTIAMLAPLLLLCALPTVGTIGFAVYWRRRSGRSPAPEALLPLLWRIENIVTSIRNRTERLVPRVARPVISAHALAAFIKRFFNQLKEVISQEIERYVDYR